MNAKFNEIINQEQLTLVDFYADWCGPCKTLSPIVQEVSSALHGRVKVIKVNVDKNPAIATQFQIRSIPTLIVFKNGQPCWTGIGIRNAREINEIIRQHL